MTFRLWLTDLAKNGFVWHSNFSYYISYPFSDNESDGNRGAMVGPALGLVVLLSVSFMIIFPLIIAPIFNKFSP